ncbi:MAG: hypothetical protein ABH867_01625 [Patescibacteria group bacterium]|nr:hypothetical protein [Patescibacteria group bacterium]
MLEGSGGNIIVIDCQTDRKLVFPTRGGPITLHNLHFDDPEIPDRLTIAPTKGGVIVQRVTFGWNPPSVKTEYYKDDEFSIGGHDRSFFIFRTRQ